MKADMRNKKFASNVYRENNFNILKTSGIYGANNAGKTCLVKCIRSIKNALLNRNIGVQCNIFHEKSICELGISFLSDGREYSYDFWYDCNKKEYPYEKFSEIKKDGYNNESEVKWLLKDNIKSQYYYKDSSEKRIADMIPMIANNSLLIYMMDVSKFELLAEMKKIVTEFASKIDIVSMYNIPIKKTIDLMKNKNNLKNKVDDFIRNADIYMDNFEYIGDDKLFLSVDSKIDEKEIDEKVLDIPEQIVDQLRLVSVYKGIPVSSMFYDSTGTKKIIALASYVIESLEQGRILIVDELDSSIHFKLTRAVVAMFNNELNINAQLIFTVHDINLMDCKKLFRKEQIWFVHKDEEGVYLYSLAEFTANDGVRDTTDIKEKYRRGVLGAVPNPDLIKTLLAIRGNKSE